MSAATVEAARLYYRDFATQGDFAALRMSDDLRFRGPLHDYRDGERYRRDCTELASMAHAITIRHQFFDGDTVHTVYDFDLGLPSGPIASAETLRFVDGVLIAADLIIDSTPLRNMARNP